jgi:hypothetical protein
MMDLFEFLFNNYYHYYYYIVLAEGNAKPSFAQIVLKPHFFLKKKYNKFFGKA